MSASFYITFCLILAISTSIVKLFQLNTNFHQAELYNNYLTKLLSDKNYTKTELKYQRPTINLPSNFQDNSNFDMNYSYLDASIDFKENKSIIAKKVVNLIYFEDHMSENGNFGDELSKFVAQKLVNEDVYDLVFNQHMIKNKNNEIKTKKIDYNIVIIGSYIHQAVDNSYIYGSGIRTDPPIEGIPGKTTHRYKNLNVCALRGPNSRKFLKNRLHKNDIPEIYGDPGLLVKKLHSQSHQNVEELNDKTCLVAHKSNLENYLNKFRNNNLPKFIDYIINPLDKWQKVVNEISSCKIIISSSLHGLIISDAYNVPNVRLDEYSLFFGLVSDNF